MRDKRVNVMAPVSDQDKRSVTVRRSWRSVLGALCIVVFAGSFYGCEGPERFKVPDYKRKRGKIKKLYEASGSIPRVYGVPAWTEAAEKNVMTLFRPEPLRIKGKLWLRESSSVIHTFYFQRSNHIAMRECLQVVNSMARFVSRWLESSFSERLHVVMMPEPDPADTSVVYNKKRMPIPDVGEPRLVIYTGTDAFPYLSKHGNIGYILEQTVRFMLTGTTKVNPKDFWRSVAIPAYFRLRGIGAMVDRTYDKTSRPRFLSSLRQAGRPQVGELQRLIQRYKAGQLPWLARRRSMELISSMLGFLEDAYGRGALGAILRQQLPAKKGKKSLSFEASLKGVIGESSEVLWKKWSRYYYSDLWRWSLQSWLR